MAGVTDRAALDDIPLMEGERNSGSAFVLDDQAPENAITEVGDGWASILAPHARRYLRDLRFSGPPAKKNSLQSGNFSRYLPGTADLLFPDVG